jgi:branched-subunit amino acid ABC-type transport system permease component
MRPAALTRPVHADATSRVIHAAHDSLIGVGVGAAAGALTALILEHSSHGGHYADHSEDGFMVAVSGVYGSFFGMIVGAIVGLVRSP